MSAALGSGFNFIDFLVNPPLMPMLIAFFVLLSERRDAGMLAFAAVLAWFGGYAETWLAKWAIAYLSAANPAAVVSDVIGTIEIRTVGAFNGVYLFPLAATLRAFLRASSRVGVIVPAADRARAGAPCRRRLAHRMAARAVALDAGAGGGAVVRGVVEPYPIPPHGERAQRRRRARHDAGGNRHRHAAPAVDPGIMGRAR